MEIIVTRLRSNRGAACAHLRLAVVLVALAPSWAHATLGGDAQSVITDQTALGASLTAEAAADYTDYRLALPDGGAVHEFVSSTGRVFEVTWSVMGHRPDMEQLLGPHSARFARSTGHGLPVSRRSDRVDADLEIHSRVRNRYFTGTAHLPAALPTSLSAPLQVPAESQK